MNRHSFKEKQNNTIQEDYVEMPVNSRSTTNAPIGILKKSPLHCVGRVDVPNSDYYADEMYDLFRRKITDAPIKLAKNASLENFQQTNGKPLNQNLFGGILDELVKYDKRKDYFDSIIGTIIGKRYEPIAVISYGDNAAEVDYFSINDHPSQTSDDLPPKKRVCM